MTTASISVLSSKGFVLHECAKLLTFCDVVIKKTEDYISIFESYNNSIKKSIDDCQKEIENLKENPTKDSKKQIKNSNKNLKYFIIISPFPFKKVCINNYDFLIYTPLNFVYIPLM